MFANNTVETGTGTGDIITLTGAVSYTNEAGRVENSRPFSLGFNDGALVSYFIVDHTGGNEVAGIGTYNAVGNTLTRNDTESYNGSILDKNPATNIALSAGTHTVRCDVVVRTISPTSLPHQAFNLSLSSGMKAMGVMGSNGGVVQSLDPTRIQHQVFFVPAGETIAGMSVSIATGVAGALTRVGMSAIDKNNGNVSSLLRESIDIDASTAGAKQITFANMFFERDTLVYGWVSNSLAVTYNAKDRSSIASNPYVNFVDIAGFRSYHGLYMPVSSGQPAYPTPIPFANGILDTLDAVIDLLLVRA